MRRRAIRWFVAERLSPPHKPTEQDDERLTAFVQYVYFGKTRTIDIFCYKIILLDFITKNESKFICSRFFFVYQNYLVRIFSLLHFCLCGLNTILDKQWSSGPQVWYSPQNSSTRTRNLPFEFMRV